MLIHGDLGLPLTFWMLMGDGCRITLLRLKPYMFEPDEDEKTGIRVKQPLASFLAKFKQVHLLAMQHICPSAGLVYACSSRCCLFSLEFFSLVQDFAGSLLSCEDL